MSKKRSFKLDGRIADVPEENAAYFIEKYPDAVEVKTFLVDKDTADVPLDKVDYFTKKYTNAKPLFEDEPTKDFTKQIANVQPFDMAASIESNAPPANMELGIPPAPSKVKVIDQSIPADKQAQLYSGLNENDQIAVTKAFSNMNENVVGNRKALEVFFNSYAKSRDLDPKQVREFGKRAAAQRMLDIGDEAFNSGNKAKAEQLYLSQVGDRSVTALNKLAKLYAANGNQEKSKQFLEEAKRAEIDKLPQVGTGSYKQPTYQPTILGASGKQGFTVEGDTKEITPDTEETASSKYLKEIRDVVAGPSDYVGEKVFIPSGEMIKAGGEKIERGMLMGMRGKPIRGGINQLYGLVEGFLGAAGMGTLGGAAFTAALTEGQERAPKVVETALWGTNLFAPYLEKKWGFSKDMANNVGLTLDILTAMALHIGYKKVKGEVTKAKNLQEAFNEIDEAELKKIVDESVKKYESFGGNEIAYQESLKNELGGIVAELKELSAIEEGKQEVTPQEPIRANNLLEIPEGTNVEFTTKNGKESGVIDRLNDGTWVFENENGVTEIPVKDKTNPIETLQELGIDIVPDVAPEQVAKALGDREQTGWVTETKGGKTTTYFVSLGNPKIEGSYDLVFEQNSKGELTSRFDSHADPVFAEGRKLKLINKYLAEESKRRGIELPPRDKVLQPPVKGEAKPIQEVKPVEIVEDFEVIGKPSLEKKINSIGEAPNLEQIRNDDISKQKQEYDERMSIIDKVKDMSEKEYQQYYNETNPDNLPSHPLGLRNTKQATISQFEGEFKPTDYEASDAQKKHGEKILDAIGSIDNVIENLTEKNQLTTEKKKALLNQRNKLEKQLNDLGIEIYTPKKNSPLEVGKVWVKDVLESNEKGNDNVAEVVRLGLIDKKTGNVIKPAEVILTGESKPIEVVKEEVKQPIAEQPSVTEQPIVEAEQPTIESTPTEPVSEAKVVEETPQAGSVGVGGDVKATAKALEDLSKNKTERFYPDDKVILTTKDGKEVEVSFRGYNGEKKAVIFGSRGSGINQMEVDVSQLRAKNKSDKLTKDERKNLLSKIDFQDKEAPAYKEDFTDKELQDLSVRYPKRDKLSNKEKNDFNDFQIATTPLKKWQEQEYGVDDPLDPTNIKLAKEHETAINNIINNDKFSTLLAEAYHKAKSDGSNPELVKAVEQSLKEMGDGANDKGVPFIKKIFDKIRSITKLNKVQHNRLFNIDTKLSKEIADAYEKMKHDPNNPKVKKAYEAMVEETKQQYNALVDGGLKAERWTGEGEPYANSAEMLNDLKENNHLWFLPNESAFGDKGAATKYKDNIGLQNSGITLDGKPLTNSEVFRIVHDAVHGIKGSEFGAIGEENATLQHLSMYSDEALPAVVAQTRGQNSWVNFSGVNDSANAKFKEAAKLEKEGKYDEAKKIRKEAQKEFTFAEPKIGLLPNKYNFRYYGTKNAELATKKKTNTRSGEGNTKESKPINALTDEKNLARESQSFSSRSNSGGRTIRTSYGDVVPKFIHTIKQSLVQGIKNVFPDATIDKELFEVDADIFHKAATKAKSVNKFGAAVDVLTQEEYSKYRLFITEDGLTGIALSKDGDLGSGFDMSGKPKRLPQLLVLGIENGATHANAFDTILPDYYSAFGFKPVARNLWNNTLKPKDWDYKLFERWNNGRPDVVHFVWDGGDRNTIHERIGQFDNYNDYHKEQTPIIDTWEEAQEIVEQSLKETPQAKEPKAEMPKEETKGSLLNYIRRFNSLSKKDRQTVGANLKAKIMEGASKIGYSLSYDNKGKLILLNKEGKRAKASPTKISDEAKQANIKRVESARKALSKMPSTLREWVLQLLLSKQSISAADLKRSTGFSPKEFPAFTVGEKGTTFHDLMEMVQGDPELSHILREYTDNTGFDNQKFDSDIADIMTSIENRESMWRELIEGNSEDAWKEQGFQNKSEYEWALELQAEAERLGVDIEDVKEMHIAEAENITKYMEEEDIIKMLQELDENAPKTIEEINKFYENNNIEQAEVNSEVSSPSSPKGEVIQAEQKLETERKGLFDDVAELPKEETKVEVVEEPKQEPKVIKDQAKKIADKIREGKVNRPNSFSTNTPASLVWDGALEVAAKTIELTGDVAQGVADAIKHIKESDWYKGLEESKRLQAEQDLTKYLKESEDVFPLGIKNESAKAENKYLGIDQKIDLTKEQKRDVKTVQENAKRFIEDGGDPELLVNETILQKRQLNAEQLSVILDYKVKLGNELKTASDKLIKDYNEGKDVTALEEKLSSLTDRYERANDALEISGYEQGLAFRMRQVMKNADYTLAESERKWRVASKGAEMPIEIKQKFSEIETKLAESEQKIAELEQARARIEAENVVNKAKNQPPKKAGDKIRLLANKIERGQISKLGGYKSSTGFDAVWDLSLKAVSETLKATGSLADAIEAGLVKVRETEWYKKLTDKKKFEQDFENHFNKQLEKAEYEAAYFDENGKLKIPFELIKDTVKEGVTDINDLVAKIKDKIIDEVTEVTDREIKEAVTEYGKTLEPNKDALLAEIRDLKRTGRLELGLDDAKSGQGVKRSGLQREAPSDYQRELQRKINEELKKYPADVADVERKWKSALDRVKTGLKNRITDITKRIDDINNGVAEPIKKKEGIPLDQEAQELKQIKDDLKAQLTELEGKPEMSDEQRISLSISAAERSIAEYQRRLDEINNTGTYTEKVKKDTPYSDKLETLKLERKRLKEEYENALENSGAAEIKATKQAIERKERQIDEVLKQINNSDPSFKKKPSSKINKNDPEYILTQKRLEQARTLLDNLREESGEANKRRLELFRKRIADRQTKLEAELKQLNEGTWKKKEPKEDLILTDEIIKEKAKADFLKFERDVLVEKEAMKNRSMKEKVLDLTLDVWNLPKSLLSSADLSAPFRQGFVLTASNPKAAFKAGKIMFEHMMSDKAHEMWIHELKQTPEYKVMKDADLYLTEPNSKLTAREENFSSNLAHKIWGWGKVVKGSERAYTAYLNKLRVDVFSDFHDTLLDSGLSNKEIAKELKSYADFINNATGRGKIGGKIGESALPLLNIVGFSPRYVASRVNLLKRALTLGTGMTPKAKMKAIKDMGLYAGTVAATLQLAKYGLGAEVELDPRSSDFGKIKIGNTRYDLMAGFQQLIVLAARITTNETIKQGRLKQLGQGYKADTRKDVLEKFARSKASPTAGTLYDFTKGRTMDGQPFNWQDAVQGNMAPITWKDAYDTYQKDGAAKAASTTIPALFGIGVQTYDK